MEKITRKIDPMDLRKLFKIRTVDEIMKDLMSDPTILSTEETSQEETTHEGTEE